MSARAEQVSPVVLVNYQLMDGTYNGRLSLRSLPLGETDAPAPVRAKEWAKGEGEGEDCSQRVVPSGGLKPLILVLSPWPRGEAKQTLRDPQPANTTVLP
jgi:hypothetical protein